MSQLLLRANTNLYIQYDPLILNVQTGRKKTFYCWMSDSFSSLNYALARLPLSARHRKVDSWFVFLLFCFKQLFSLLTFMTRSCLSIVSDTTHKHNLLETISLYIILSQMNNNSKLKKKQKKNNIISRSLWFLKKEWMTFYRNMQRIECRTKSNYTLFFSIILDFKTYSCLHQLWYSAKALNKFFSGLFNRTGVPVAKSQG